MLENLLNKNVDEEILSLVKKSVDYLPDEDTYPGISKEKIQYAVLMDLINTINEHYESDFENKTYLEIINDRFDYVSLRMGEKLPVHNKLIDEFFLQTTNESEKNLIHKTRKELIENTYELVMLSIKHEFYSTLIQEMLGAEIKPGRYDVGIDA